MAKQKHDGAGLGDQLRELVRGSGKTLMQLTALTGVDPARLSRFLNSKRGLSQDALDSIFQALCIRLVRDGDASLPVADAPKKGSGRPPNASAEAPVHEAAPTKKGRRKKRQ